MTGKVFKVRVRQAVRTAILPDYNGRAGNLSTCIVLFRFLPSCISGKKWDSIQWNTPPGSTKEAREEMTVTLDLPAEVEEKLRERASANGVRSHSLSSLTTTVLFPSADPNVCTWPLGH